MAEVTKIKKEEVIEFVLNTITPIVEDDQEKYIGYILNAIQGVDYE